MFSSIVLFSLLTGLIVASFVLWALFLRLGLRWAQVPDVNTRRIVLAITVIFILETTLAILALLVTPLSDVQATNIGLLELAASVIVPCTVISAVFKAPFLRAIQAWLPTLLGTFATLAFSLVVMRPFLYESFVAPTNSMAPTLVGQHWKGTCQECGQPTYCSLQDFYPPLMICDNFHVTEALAVDRTIHTGDRFMVAKFLSPRRWDLVVFKYPGDPTSLYVKRLVGFPGERIQIQDGAVWVNGEPETCPESLRDIEYLSEMPVSFGVDIWGSANRPALLGNDEYFVLGDFSAQSADSRLWEHGATGHNPFAVPESYMIGVVTHTFWPAQRWRIHR